MERGVDKVHSVVSLHTCKAWLIFASLLCCCGQSSHNQAGNYTNSCWML